MTSLTIPHLSRRQRLGLGGAALLALGAAGGAGAVSMTRPTVEMAPTLPTAVAHLADKTGVVTVRGRIAEVYGDRFVIQDASGRALVDVGRGSASGITTGSPIMVQGRFDNGQLHARYLVDASGSIEEVGPGRRGHDSPPPPHPGGPGAPPPPRPGGPDAPPPPPPPVGPCAPPAPGAGAPPPPPGIGTSPPVAGASGMTPPVGTTLAPPPVSPRH